MELIFPFKNIAFNHLLEFSKKDKIWDFVTHIQGNDPNRFFERNVEIYKQEIPDYENEILQILETSSQKAIDAYFKELIDNIYYGKDQFSVDNIRDVAKNGNSEELMRFEKRIEKEEQKYFESEHRKLKHLEVYQERYPLIPLLGYPLGDAKRTAVNYNFYCVESSPDLVETVDVDKYIDSVSDLYNDFLHIAKKYGIPWQEGKIKSKISSAPYLKPVIFFEGETDIDYVVAAAKVLNQEDLLAQVELRQRGSSSNLTKLWHVLKESNWETIPQKKLFIYDCDTNKGDEDFGHIFRRTLPRQNNMILNGIENLFPNSFIEKAIAHKLEFVDYKEILGTERGKKYKSTEYLINKDEKRNFCSWTCKHGEANDFKSFDLIFKLIEDLLNR